MKGVFDKIGDAFLAERPRSECHFSISNSGPGGGEWYTIIKEGQCEAAAGKHEKPTTTIMMADEDFLALISGQLNAMKAYTSGKLKIDGDLMKSQLIEKLFKF